MSFSRPAKVSKTHWVETRRKSAFGSYFYDPNDFRMEFSLKMCQISPEERSDGLNDLHGVSEPIVETFEMILSKIVEMTNSLHSFVSNDTRGAQQQPRQHYESFAYQRAVDKSPAYVDSLKVRFLRASVYDSQAAAHRMIRFFDQKMVYFGEDMLVQDITFDDLKEEDIDGLQKGLFLLLPERDQAGRPVVMFRGSISTDYSTESVMRVFLYFFMATLADEELQKTGVVLVNYVKGQKYLVPGRIPALNKLWCGLPARVDGYHNCQDRSGVFDSIRDLYAKIADNRLLCRYRVHTGSHIECIYYLMTFGIKREAIPIYDDGTVDLTHHYQTLETLKYREKQRKQKQQIQVSDYVTWCAGASNTTITAAMTSTTASNNDSSSMSCSEPPINEIILLPRPMDILLGKGRRQEKRPGMLRLMNLLDEYWDEYEAVSKFGKKQIARDILIRLKKEYNCRFLNEVPGGYEECDDAIARDRIARKFRTERGKKKRGGNAIVTTTAAADATTTAAPPPIVTTTTTTTATTATTATATTTTDTKIIQHQFVEDMAETSKISKIPNDIFRIFGDNVMTQREGANFKFNRAPRKGLKS